MKKWILNIRYWDDGRRWCEIGGVERLILNWNDDMKFSFNYGSL